MQILRPTKISVLQELLRTFQEDLQQMILSEVGCIFVSYSVTWPCFLPQAVAESKCGMADHIYNPSTGDPEGRGQPGLHSHSWDNLYHRVRPCLQKPGSRETAQLVNSCHEDPSLIPSHMWWHMLQSPALGRWQLISYSPLVE